MTAEDSQELELQILQTKLDLLEQKKRLVHDKQGKEKKKEKKTSQKSSSEDLKQEALVQAQKQREEFLASMQGYASDNEEEKKLESEDEASHNSEEESIYDKLSDEQRQAWDEIWDAIQQIEAEEKPQAQPESIASPDSVGRMDFSKEEEEEKNALMENSSEFTHKAENDDAESETQAQSAEEIEREEKERERKRIYKQLDLLAEIDQLKEQLNAQKQAQTASENKAPEKGKSGSFKAVKSEEKPARKQSIFEKINAFFAPKDVQDSSDSWEQTQECVQNDLGYELLRSDGIMRVEEGLYARAIVFEDVNYQGALYDTQLEIHSNMNELYNSLPENCAIQLFMHTRKLHTEELINTLHIPLVEEDDKYNSLREEQNQIIDLKMSTTAQNVTRTHCFVVSCEDLNMSRAKKTLDSAMTGIERKLKDIESKYKILDGPEWLNLINHITNPDDDEGLVSFEDLAAMPGATTRDLIAPPNITTYGKKGFSMGDYYYRVLYVSKYSNTVRDNFFSQLAEMPYNSIISMHAKPYDHADAIDLVTAKRTDLTMQKKQYIKKNPSAAYQDEEMLPGNLGDQLKNTRETRTDLIHREQSMFDQSIVVMLYADTLDGLDNAYAEVKRISKGHNYRLSPLNDMQLMGLKSALPIGNNNVPISRALMTDALSNFSPFTADELFEKDGIFSGLNTLSKNAIAYDRTRSIAPNGFILGKPGRGKSVYAKYQIIQVLCRDPKAKVMVLDPEGEYGSLCKLLPDAQLIQLTQSSSSAFNPLDINDSYSEDENPLSFKTDFIISLVDMMTKGMTQTQINILDRVVRFIYQEYFKTKDPSDMPTLQTLYDEMRRQSEPEAQALATNIERFVEGSMNMFNAHTNVNLNARLIVFDTKELQRNLSPVALLILLDQVWNFISSGRSQGSHTWFYVDEMQLLTDNEYAITYLDRLFSRARKWGAIPTGITQNVERVLAVEQFRYMIGNSDLLVILGQSKTDTDALGDVLKLSNEQRKAVRTAGIGEGLLLANGKVVQFENKLPKMINGKPSNIYRALTTKLEDLVEMGAIG